MIGSDLGRSKSETIIDAYVCKMHHVFLYFKSYIFLKQLLTCKTFCDYTNNGLMKQIPKDSFWVDFSSTLVSVLTMHRFYNGRRTHVFPKTPRTVGITFNKCVVRACVNTDRIKRKSAVLSDQRSPFKSYLNIRY